MSIGTSISLWLIILAAYLVITNIIGFILMYVDKEKAKKGQWRIKEATLFLVAAIGGSIGSILGMQVFRHKTKHMSFVIGMPAILVAQLAIAAVLYFFVL